MAHTATPVVTTKGIQVGNVFVYGVFSPENLTREVLGGKGFSLMQLAAAGLNVPPAAILPTSYGAEYLKDPIGVAEQVTDFVDVSDVFLSCSTNGADSTPPLLSVRSGARVSMAGMMDTVLNVGISPDNLKEYSKLLGSYCANDCLDRFSKMFSTIVLGVPEHNLEQTLSARLIEICNQLQTIEFPDRRQQLNYSAQTVLESWNTDRAKYYRKMHGIPDHWGTAVILQRMVFGNLDGNSCTGVMFTGNPDTGDIASVGEFLKEAQGEDVVSGKVTPLPLKEMLDWKPHLYADLIDNGMRLQKEAGDILDLEFTIESGVLYYLQCRSAKRTGLAALEHSLRFLSEGGCTPEHVLRQVKPEHLESVSRDRVDDVKCRFEDFDGLPASAGVVQGYIVKSSEDAVKHKGKCIMVTPETTPDDIEGMDAALGVITLQGGSTSHAAVVARDMNKPCITGVASVSPKYVSELHAGRYVTMCGSTGRIWLDTDLEGRSVAILKGDSSKLDAWAETMAEAIGVCLIPVANPLATVGIPDMFSELKESPFKIVEASPTLLGDTFLSQLAPVAPTTEEAVKAIGFSVLRNGAVEQTPLVEHTNFQKWVDCPEPAIYTGTLTKAQAKLLVSIQALREKVYGVLPTAGEGQLYLTQPLFLSLLMGFSTGAISI